MSESDLRQLIYKLDGINSAALDVSSRSREIDRLSESSYLVKGKARDFAGAV